MVPYLDSYGRHWSMCFRSPFPPHSRQFMAWGVGIVRCPFKDRESTGCTVYVRTLECTCFLCLFDRVHCACLLRMLIAHVHCACSLRMFTMHDHCACSLRKLTMHDHCACSLRKLTMHDHCACSLRMLTAYADLHCLHSYVCYFFRFAHNYFLSLKQ